MRHARIVVLPILVALSSASESAHLNHSGDWWAGALEEDAILSLPLDGDGGLWASAFVPPPPRPEYLDDNVTPDGLTTCDLCSWAWRDRGGLFSVDAAQGSTGELGWVFTLAIVSLLSAAIGAVVMISLLQCRNKMKNIGSTCLCSLCITRSSDPAPTPVDNHHLQEHGDKNLTTFDVPISGGGGGNVPVINVGSSSSVGGGGSSSGGGVWAWLSIRRPTTAPIQLSATPTIPVENHYTLDETYTCVDEALYAELDREADPAYQNTAYEDPDLDAPVSSAPSSAYYSDLSCTDRTYEAVGVGAGWDASDLSQRRSARLTAIRETTSVPSDYV